MKEEPSSYSGSCSTSRRNQPDQPNNDTSRYCTRVTSPAPVVLAALLLCWLFGARPKQRQTRMLPHLAWVVWGPAQTTADSNVTADNAQILGSSVLLLER